EPLEWRAYDPESTLSGGYVSFDEFLRPNQHVFAYATTWVKVDKAQTAVLQFGSGGAHAIWVGTREVGRGDAYRTPDPLQNAYSVPLAAGWNRILVKVGCDTGAWGFYAQLRTSAGERIAGFEDRRHAARADHQSPARGGPGRGRSRGPRALPGIRSRCAACSSRPPRARPSPPTSSRWPSSCIGSGPSIAPSSSAAIRPARPTARPSRPAARCSWR
ncbi:hypothetical protein ACNOYE_40300, partial [Nannocystaceae bacterium ST9]